MVSSRGHHRPRGVKRKMSNYPLRPRAPIDSERRKVAIIILPPSIDSIGSRPGRDEEVTLRDAPGHGLHGQLDALNGIAGRMGGEFEIDEP